MRFTLLIVTFLFTQTLAAQNEWRLYGDDNAVEENALIEEEEVFIYDSSQSGSILIKSDPQIDSLIALMDKNPPAIKGYRVEIFFGQRKEAEQVKSEFLKSYENWPIYVVWQQPNFKVQVGDFMTKLQAEKTQQEIRSKYPNSYIAITDIKFSED